MTDSPDSSAISSETKTRTKRKPRTVYRYPIVVVVWDDAETAGGWEELPEELRPALATTAGFLVKESEDHILIASSYDERHTNGRLQIPKGMVKEIRYLDGHKKS